MSVPSNSTSPTPISVSDPTVVAGETSVVRLGKRVRDWVTGLSPAGATVYDTGWVPITSLATGFTPAGFAYRRIGRQVSLRGAITRTAGSFPSGATAIGSLPSGIAPGAFGRWPAATAVNATVTAFGLQIDAAGAMQVLASGPATHASVYVDGVQFWMG